MIGKKFGKLTVLKKLEERKRGKIAYECMCDCGNVAVVIGSDLKSGHIKSCGCLHGNNHKLSRTRIYSIYRHMKDRCYNKNNKRYKSYGGRGIVICDEWLNNNTLFFDWAMNNGYKDNLTIDRIDVNGNYSPDNCRWITNDEQQRNRRDTRNYTINGVTHCLKDWCEIYNLKYNTVRYRLNRGWNIEKALEL